MEEEPEIWKFRKEGYQNYFWSKENREQQKRKGSMNVDNETNGWTQVGKFIKVDIKLLKVPKMGNVELPWEFWSLFGDQNSNHPLNLYDNYSKKGQPFSNQYDFFIKMQLIILKCVCKFMGIGGGQDKEMSS